MIPIRWGQMLALSMITAARSWAACSCLIVTPADQPVPRILRASEAPVLFAGRALAVDTVGNDRLVRFAVDSSWRGAMPDSVTVVVGDDAPCALFQAGRQYLVGAHVVGPTLRLLRCGDGLELADSFTQQLLSEVAGATWRAPPVGQRDLDRASVPIDRAPEVGGARDTVRFLIPLDLGAATFEIAGMQRSPRTTMEHFVLLPAGLYRYRVQRGSATVVESYVLLRCEQPGPPYCSALRPGLNRD